MNTAIRIALCGIIVCIVSSGATFAAPLPSLTLDQAVKEAKDMSPELKRAESAAEASSWGRLESFAAYLPKVNFRVDHFLDYKFQQLHFGVQSVDAAYPLTLLTIEGTWTLFDGFAGWNNYQASRLQYSAAQDKLNRVDFQLSKEVQLRFYQALAAQFLADVANQNIQTLEEHLNEARIRQKAGVATQFDVLRIEVQLEEARSDKVLSDDQVAITRMKLGQVMGEENDSRLLDGTLPVPKADLVPQDLSLEIKSRPDISAQVKQEEANERSAAAAKAHWLPRFSLFANAQRYDNISNRIDIGSQFNNAYAVGMTLSWSILSGGSDYARQQSAYYHSEESKYGLAGVLLQTETDFKVAKRRYFYGITQYQARVRAVAKAEESVRLAKIGLKAGTRTNTEMLDAELDLMRTRAGVIRAQADAFETLINLELATERNFL
jgi:outer membrane protein TolC